MINQLTKTESGPLATLPRPLGSSIAVWPECTSGVHFFSFISMVMKRYRKDDLRA